MEKHLRGLRNLTYMCLGAGLVMCAAYYFMRFRFGVNHEADLLAGATLFIMGCCTSQILKILKALDARLNQIEDSNTRKTP